MSLELSKKQLAPLVRGESNAITVHDADSDLNYVVIPESAYKKAQPLLDLISSSDDSPGESAIAWTDRDNQRRIELITRKHESEISGAEEEELAELQSRAYRFRKQESPVDNSVLTLLLEALENRAIGN